MEKPANVVIVFIAVVVVFAVLAAISHAFIQ
jgi:hypothetical protein